MTFVQTISFTTSRMNEMQKLMDDFSEANLAGGSAGFVRTQVLKDREHENAYVVVAEFATYEEAMQNSGRPETDAFAKAMGAMCDAPPVFGNYDKVSEETA